MQAEGGAAVGAGGDRWRSPAQLMGVGVGSGNLWQELWKSARAVPAARQTPLFDEDLSG